MCIECRDKKIIELYLIIILYLKKNYYKNVIKIFVYLENFICRVKLYVIFILVWF